MTDVLSLAHRLAGEGRAAEGARLLEKASRSGDPRATAELGLWLLRGDKIARNLSLARVFLREAADFGVEDSILSEIALSANGGGGRIDWASALSLLQKSAQNIPYLADELKLVQSLDLDEEGYPRQDVRKEMIDERIALMRLPSFLSSGECLHLANIASHTLSPSTVFDPSTGREIADPVRTSDSTVISPTEEDLVLQAIFRRIAAATGTNLANGESLSVLRYGPGQQYKPHFDAMNGTKNNRIKTVLMYLNDGYEGGQTTFPDLGITVEPKAGDAVVFDGLLPDGSTQHLSRHAGLPVTCGAKWLATRWIRAHSFDPWAVASEGPDGLRQPLGRQ